MLNANFLTLLNRGGAVSQNSSIYFKQGELYVRDTSGREIQITHEGGTFISSVGSSIGPLWASSNDLLQQNITNGVDIFAETTADTSNQWVIDSEAPEGTTIEGGGKRVGLPTSPQNGQVGWWLLAKRGANRATATTTSSVLIPFGLTVKDDDTTTGIPISDVSGILKLFNRSCTVSWRFFIAEAGGNYEIAILGDGGTNKNAIGPNEFIEIRPAIVTGARGPTGPVGPPGNVDFTLPAVNPQEDIVFAVQERPVNTTNITTGPVPSGWGDYGWVNQTGFNVGSITLPLNDGIVLISNTRIAYASASSADIRVKNIYIGNTEYSVNWLARNGILNGTEVIYSEITDPLPAGPWNNLKLELVTGAYDPAGSADEALRAGTLDKRNLHDLLDIKGVAPTKANIYPPTKDILKAGANIQITPDDDAQSLTIVGADVAVDTPAAN